jgi:hypothetical protein
MWPHLWGYGVGRGTALREYSRTVGNSNPPGKLKKFLFREEAPSDSTQTCSFYAYGYARAFQQLAEAALQRWPGGGHSRMPLFFLARHSIELTPEGRNRALRALLDA